MSEQKTPTPVRRSWRVAVQLAGPPPVLGVALVVAETANLAAQRCRRELDACTVFEVMPASET